MKVAKVELLSQGSSYISSMRDISSLITDIMETEEGEVFIITIQEMTKKAYEELPEFTGW